MNSHACVLWKGVRKGSPISGVVTLYEVLELLADTPTGITARDIQRARIVPFADEAHALLERLEAEGELAGKDSMPGNGGHISRIYTKARK